MMKGRNGRIGKRERDGKGKRDVISMEERGREVKMAEYGGNVDEDRVPR